jgi:hypothetical protein
MGAIKPWHLALCLLFTLGVTGVIAAVTVILVKSRR